MIIITLQHLFSWFCLEMFGCCFSHSGLSLGLRNSGQILQTKTTTSDFEKQQWNHMLRSHYSLNMWQQNQNVVLLFSNCTRFIFILLVCIFRGWYNLWPTSHTRLLPHLTRPDTSYNGIILCRIFNRHGI